MVKFFLKAKVGSISFNINPNQMVPVKANGLI